MSVPINLIDVHSDAFSNQSLPLLQACGHLLSRVKVDQQLMEYLDPKFFAKDIDLWNQDKFDSRTGLYLEFENPKTNLKVIPTIDGRNFGQYLLALNLAPEVGTGLNSLLEEYYTHARLGSRNLDPYTDTWQLFIGVHPYRNFPLYYGVNWRKKEATNLGLNSLNEEVIAKIHFTALQLMLFGKVNTLESKINL